MYWESLIFPIVTVPVIGFVLSTNTDNSLDAKLS